MNEDPRDIIYNSAMKPLQIIVVAITIGLNALDGFDVLSISFASPGIAAEWGIDRAALGIVLSMELIGMAFGSIFIGRLADRIGRRPTTLGCLFLMALGMFMVTTTHSLFALSAWRVLTGLGIGGMLAAVTAVAAEFSNGRSQNLCISIMAIGYPIGAVVGGSIASALLETHGWRSVFYIGATASVLCIPLTYFWIPESVHWLTRKQPAGALEKINATLTRLGHGVVQSLPEIQATVKKRAADIFAPTFIATTVLVSVAYFLHITTFYFIVKWVPKIVVDMGFAASSAGFVLVWTNVGGAIGGAVFGLLTLRFGLKPLTIAVLLLSTVAVTLFGRTPPDLARLSLICACAGFCTNAGIVGLYSILAQAFPTHLRASGTGFAVGFGRGGSVLAPILAGFLFTGGLKLPAVALLMSLGSTLAAGVLLLLKLRPDRQPAGTGDDAEPKLTASPAR